MKLGDHRYYIETEKLKKEKRKKKKVIEYKSSLEYLQSMDVSVRHPRFYAIYFI